MNNQKKMSLRKRIHKQLKQVKIFNYQYKPETESNTKMIDEEDEHIDLDISEDSIQELPFKSEYNDNFSIYSQSTLSQKKNEIQTNSGVCSWKTLKKNQKASNLQNYQDYTEKFQIINSFTKEKNSELELSYCHSTEETLNMQEEKEITKENSYQKEENLNPFQVQKLKCFEEQITSIKENIQQIMQKVKVQSQQQEADTYYKNKEGNSKIQQSQNQQELISKQIKKKKAKPPTKNIPKIYINSLIRYTQAIKIRVQIIKWLDEYGYQESDFDQFCSILKISQTLQNLKVCFGVNEDKYQNTEDKKKYKIYSEILRKCFYKFIREEANCYFFRHRKIENPVLVRSFLKAFKFLVQFPLDFQEIRNPTGNNDF